MKALKIALIFISLVFMGFGASKAVASASYDELLVVVEAVVDASWDLPSGPHWKMQSSKKGLIGCSAVDSEEVVEVISAGIESFAAFYVDEDLPYEVALEQLQELASEGRFEICQGNILKGPYPLILSL